MKRKAKKRYEELYRFRSLVFWYPCSKCKKEFRREKGWRGLTGPFVNQCGRWRYLCRECAPTREEADDYFLNDRWRVPPPTSRPAPPPAPPRAKTVNCSPELFGLSVVKKEKEMNTKDWYEEIEGSVKVALREAKEEGIREERERWVKMISDDSLSKCISVDKYYSREVVKNIITYVKNIILKDLTLEDKGK